MKRAIYYTVCSTFWGYSVMAVTSEKKGRIHRLYGRVKDEATQVAACYSWGQFPDHESAAAKLEVIKALRETYKDLRAPFKNQLAELDAEERVKISEILGVHNGAGKGL